MASQTGRYNFHDHHYQPVSPTKLKQHKTSGGAKRALRSLAFSVAAPQLLTLSVIFLFGSGGGKYRALSEKQPFWFPPLWLVHAAALGSSLSMSLAAWLVWADGGFRSETDALPLYVAQVSLSVVWDPLVLVIGAAWLGLVFCVVHFGTLFGCYVCFKRVNPFAKDLVKPCLAWMGFLTLVSYKLMFVF
ncbi:hypothetical protein ACOSQ3_007529 [Xanthoceras sorbifolium]